MAQETAPAAPRLIGTFVDQDGRLTRDGMVVLEQMWRQVVAGFVIVPCQASGTNAITLTPTMHEEGGRSYADHMAFAAPAVNTSTDVVTAAVADLPELKVYKNGGADRAGSGDVVASSLYLFVYYAELDGGNGGLVLIGAHQPLDATLTALAAYNTNGLITQTAADTFTGRTITGTTDRISLTYGDGVSGNPTVDIASGYVGQETITTLGVVGTGEWKATTLGVRFGGTGQTTYTNGQLLIGNTTNNTLAKGTLTAGTGITITNGGGSITPAVNQSFAPTWTGAHIWTVAAPQITLNNATSNWIHWLDVGLGAPTFTTRSVGTKLVLRPNISGSAADYAIGVESSFLWFGTTTTSTGFKWYGGTTLAATLSGAGVFTPVGLIDISGAGAGQIQFPATQNASAGANTLDDYEEGTYTPTFSALGTPPTSVTYTTQTASYTKIGRLVFAQWRVTLSSKGTGGVGQVAIGALPFSAATNVTSTPFRGASYTNPSSGIGQFGFTSGTNVAVCTSINTNGAVSVTWADVTDTYDNMGAVTYYV